ncbi:MAG: VOC family protein [Nocardioidaceae bacterium]
MTDPFEALRAPALPVDPDPTFAAALRARIERSLNLPRGVIVSDVSTLPESAESSPAADEPVPAAIPYLAVRGARDAIDWYIDVLGARLVGEPIVMRDGRIGHATLELSGGVLYLSEEHPELGVVAPTPGAHSVSLMLNVADADATLARAVERGGSSDREPYDDYGARNAWMVDPFGHRWCLQGPIPGAADAVESDRIRQGDIGYVSVWTPDLDRALRFYGDVLGWTYASGSSGQGRYVLGTSLPTGVWGGQESSTLFCCYAVDDIDAAVERVREAGGTADEPTDSPDGRRADCVDNQGVPLALMEAGSGPRPPLNGRVHGDLTYFTMEVVDSAAARRFYGAVLGWEFSPGGVEDGWGPADVHPMTGMSGGHDGSAGVPMWVVDDITAAVEQVRSAGGTATDPEQQPYAISSVCTDDQGAKFYLGQY